MPAPDRNEAVPNQPNLAGGFARLGMALADWSERWFPDSFVFTLAVLVIAFAGSMFLGATIRDLFKDFGEGFWSLIPFTMQMAIMIIGGYVVASSPPIYGVIRWLAKIPRTPRGAVAFVAFFSMATSMISWGFSLIFSGMLVREIVRNVPRIDYRAIGAASYMGTGSVWALGLSSSAALMMATPSAIAGPLLAIGGVIPLSQTIYTWQSLTTAAVLIFSGVVVAYLSAPATSTKTAESFGVTEGVEFGKLEKRRTPAEWLEHAPALSILVGVIGLGYLVLVFRARGPLAALDLNTYNLLFLVAGLLLHWRPSSFTRAVNGAVPATAGVLVQFPFYGGILGIVTMSPVTRTLAHFLVRVSSKSSYPVVVAVYSFILGMFVPSGGGKWVIEAPYVLQAAKDLHVSLGWIVQVYNASEALPNLINPFWMLPLVGILKVRARDLVGYGLLQLIVNTLWVLFFAWFFARTFTYAPPVIP
ncbi:MAG: TIGR00366 family protein [Candidatus Acidiferrales bacterium]